LLSKWVGTWDLKLKDEMLLPVFLQETGKFILSDVAKENNMDTNFLNIIKDDISSIAQTEQDFFGVTSSRITALIFKQWGLDEKLIKIISSVDNIENCEGKYLIEAQVLDIIKILCNPIDPLGDKSIKIALEKAKKYGLHIKSLEKAIETMQDRILDAM